MAQLARRRWTLLLTGACGVSAIAVWAAGGAPPLAAPSASDAMQLNGSRTRQTHATSKVRGVDGQTWAVGDASVHRIVYALDFVRTAADVPGMRLQLEASWESVVIKIDADKVTLSVRLAEVKTNSADVTSGSAPGDGWQDDLSHPFVARYSPAGTLLDVAFEREADPFAKNVLQTLLALAQFTAAPKTEAGVWEVQERDPTGSYTARYEKLGERAYSKQKRAYQAGGSATDTARGLTTLRVEQSHARADLDDRGRLQSLRLDETVEALVSDAKVGFKARQTLNVSFLRRSVLTSEQLPRTDELVFASIAADPKLFERARQSADRSLVAGASWKQLMDEAAQLDASHPGYAQARASLRHRLSAAIRLDPNSIPAMLADARGKPGALALLSGALAQSQTAEGTQALSAVLTDSATSTDAKVQAASLLGGSEAATPTTIDGLVRGSKDPDPAVRQASLLSLGAAARSARPQSPAAARDAITSLVTTLETSAPADKLELVKALGNAGASEILPTVQQWLKSAPPSMRRVAVSALRFVEGAEADALIIRTMLDDPDASVRKAAVSIVHYRPLEPLLLGALQRVVQRDVSPLVRLAVIEELGAALARSPRARQILELVASSEPEPVLRENAARQLQSGTKR